MTTPSITAPTTFQTDAARSAITTEQLALIGFASGLSTCVNNDDTGSKKAKSVRDEAKLLMSLLMGKKASDILSEEIGVNDADDEQGETFNSVPKNLNAGDFTFTYPTLSLQPGSDTATRKGDANSSTAQNQEADLTPPPELLARLQSVNDKDAVKDCSEKMAQNVLESFGAALIWRAKTWVNSLSEVLRLRVTAPGESSGPAQSEISNYDREQDMSSFDASEIFLKSREMQIIDAIIRSSEEVSVVNVKTSFRVMPHRIQESIKPPLKKQKSEADEEANAYKVMHKLHFEAMVSMTSNEGDRYKKVKLQAPGTIEGVFCKGVPSAGDEFLRSVSIKIDTDAFAFSLERESRSTVRRAAEAALLAASGMEVSDVAHNHHSIISPRYVLMSPMQQHEGSDQETDLTQSTLSTTIPEDGGYSDSSARTTPSLKDS